MLLRLTMTANPTKVHSMCTREMHTLCKRTRCTSVHHAWCALAVRIRSLSPLIQFTHIHTFRSAHTLSPVTQPANHFATLSRSVIWPESGQSVNSISAIYSLHCSAQLTQLDCAFAYERFECSERSKRSKDHGAFYLLVAAL